MVPDSPRRVSPAATHQIKSKAELAALSIILLLSGDRTFSPSVCKAWVIEQMVAIELLTLLVEFVLVLRGLF
jgi:hypothetical protein